MAFEWITFHVTDRCQLDCEHCLRDPGQKPLDLSVELVTRVLAEGKRVYRAAHTAFTGGEPTLHPQFMALVDAAVDQGYTWHMVTNGRRLPAIVSELSQKPARLAGLTAINLSLDGASEALHDGIRGEGSYREVMTAASLCTAVGIPFVINMTVHARNVHEIEAMGLMAAQLGARGVSYVMVQATGTHYDAGFYLSAAAWRGVVDRIDRLRHLLTINISMPEGHYREQPVHVCTAFAQQQAHVDVEGRLTLCCQHAGTPSPSDGPHDIAGDLSQVNLLEAHGNLVDIIHGAQQRKLQELGRGPLDEWGHFPCNHCLKSFGKPHWTAEGAGGPDAKRERWQGAREKKNALPVLRR